MKSDFINIVCYQLRSFLTNLKWGIDLFVNKNFFKRDYFRFNF